MKEFSNCEKLLLPQESKRLENSANFLLLLIQNQVAHLSPVLNSLKSLKELDSYEIIFKQELIAI